jgi:spore coat polysaccharide biosynthesis protein SpsF (cytidylyltransferase family)
MKTVAIIQARMGSSRLPDKVLMPVLGKPLLGWMLRRISSCPEVNEIVVATTIHQRDDVIAEFVQAAGYQVYRGSEEDVLDRYYQAASNLMPDAVVRLTADCPLLDPILLGTLIQKFQSGGVDFLSNSEPLPSSWPDGMDISIMSFKALQRAWQEAKKPSDREHVTFYFWNNPGIFKCQRIDHLPDLSKYRLTIDYPEDFLLLKAVMEHFGQPDPTQIVLITMDTIVTYLHSEPEIFALNNRYTRGLGWKPAFEQDKRLGF